MHKLQTMNVWDKLKQLLKFILKKKDGMSY